MKMNLAFLVTLVFVGLRGSHQERWEVCEYNHDHSKAVCIGFELMFFSKNISFIDFDVKKLVFDNVTGSLNFSNNSLFSNLTYLSVAHSQIDDVSLDAFPNLKFLILKHNNLPDLTQNVFGNIVRNLTWLSLVGNDHKIEQNSLHSLKNLTWLHVQDQIFERLSGDFLKEASSLHELTIKNCKLKEVSPNAFDNAPEMEILSLNFNNIDNFEKGTFDNLKKLKVLELHHNRFVDLDLEQFRGLTSLEVLGLPSNFLKNIENVDDLLDVFPNLKKMEVKKRDLTKKDVRPLIENLRKMQIHIIGTPHDHHHSFHCHRR